jgi:hypothetical protein
MGTPSVEASCVGSGMQTCIDQISTRAAKPLDVSLGGSTLQDLELDRGASSLRHRVASRPDSSHPQVMDSAVMHLDRESVPPKQGKRPHAEAYTVVLEQQKLRFLTRVVAAAKSGTQRLTVEQARDALEAGLISSLDRKRLAHVARVHFNLAAVEVVEWPKQYAQASFHASAAQPTSAPRYKDLDSLTQVDLRSAAGQQDVGTSDADSECSAPSLVSRSDISEDSFEGGSSPPGPSKHVGECYCLSTTQVASNTPRATVVFNVKRPSEFSNPFFMSHEDHRNRVCDAYHAWWESRDATVQSIALRFDVPIARPWKGHEIARTAVRAASIVNMASVLSNGGNIALACACSQGQRCHAHTIRSEVITLSALQKVEAKAAAKAAEATEVACKQTEQKRPSSFCIIYAGKRTNAQRLAAKLFKQNPGCRVDEFDILNGANEDVRNTNVQARIFAALFAREYDAVFVAIPCSSYAIVRGKKLRSKREPDGCSPIPKEWLHYLNKHNALSSFGESVVEVCESLGIAWMIENPAQRGDKSTDAYWKEFEDWGFLWDRPRIKQLISRGARKFLLPHCAFGSPFQKYIEILCSVDLLPLAEQMLGCFKCTHTKHADQAVGKDDRGRSKAGFTATYPEKLNELIALLLIRFVSENLANREPRKLVTGSSKPHDKNAEDQQFQRSERWAKPGSLRSLEPELPEVLAVESLPRTNVPRKSEPVEPPPKPAQVPGPFTTAQLIPAGVVPSVVNYGKRVTASIDRSLRGTHGWRQGKQLRPDPLVFEEHEALNECGRGFAWTRVDPSAPLTDESLWAAIVPSSWPDDPPCPEEGAPKIDASRWSEWAKRTDFTDLRIDSWNKHGYPGAGLPNVAVLVPTHVGALKEAESLDERNKRDVDSQFLSSGSEFPAIWPLICDPVNIVVQNGKPRLTIDKSMWISGRKHLPPYNFVIDLDEQGRLYGRLQLVRVWQFTRGAAILMTAAKSSDPVQLELAIFDLEAFFRMHPKQRLHMRESGRILKSGYHYDRRPNFGERDAPDHTCGESDGLCWFCRHELRRLDENYPSRVQSINLWLQRRATLRESDDSEDGMSRFIWDVLFYLVFYVDDGGLESWTEPLFDHKGNQIFVLETRADGVQVKKPRLRIEMYFDACIGIAEYVGHSCPDAKRQLHARRRIYLGISIDLQAQRRLLPKVKSQAYHKLVMHAMEGRRVMPNGVPLTDLATFVSLLHKLFHASDTIPLGRQHLFHCRQAIKQARDVVIGRSRTMSGVLVTAAVRKELLWWAHQLEHVDLTGLPLASRYSFPGTSSDSHLIRYSDAARELEQRVNKSGAGAWCIIKGVFYYVQFLYTPEELQAYSINVLEAHARDASGKTFLDKARMLGCSITHTTAYVDNTTAQHVAESGRTSTEMLNALNTLRLEDLIRREVFETNERVASVDNDVADALSRMDLEEALRFPRDCGLEIVRLEVPNEYRAFPKLA